MNQNQSPVENKSGVEGMTSLPSAFGPDETMARLEKEIVAGGTSVFSRVNHAALAAGVGMTLRPTEVILFGNPRGGTPLMQASQTIGIDLPLKALVWQDASGQTWLSYNEPSWLVRRHDVSGIDDTVAAMRMALRIAATQSTKDVSGGLVVARVK